MNWELSQLTNVSVAQMSGRYQNKMLPSSSNPTEGSIIRSLEVEPC